MRSARAREVTATVEVFVQLIDAAGAQYWQRFRALTDSHDAAAADALQALAGAFRVLDVLTFDGPPRQWTISAEERKP